MQGFFEKFLNRFLVFEKPKNKHFQGVWGAVPIHATLRSRFFGAAFCPPPSRSQKIFFKIFCGCPFCRPPATPTCCYCPVSAPLPDSPSSPAWSRFDFPIPSRLSQKISRKVLTPKKCYGCNQIEGKVVSMKLFRSKQGWISKIVSRIGLSTWSMKQIAQNVSYVSFSPRCGYGCNDSSSFLFYMEHRGLIWDISDFARRRPIIMTIISISCLLDPFPAVSQLSAMFRNSGTSVPAK